MSWLHPVGLLQGRHHLGPARALVEPGIGTWDNHHLAEVAQAASLTHQRHIQAGLSVGQQHQKGRHHVLAVPHREARATWVVDHQIEAAPFPGSNEGI
jgi:hypothetical protein